MEKDKVQKKHSFVIAVLNLKGGVGKTTVSAHLFRVLFGRLHAATLLIDLDPQFNLTQTLLTRLQYDKLKADEKTVLSIMEPPPAVGLFDIKTTNAPPPLPEEIVLTLWHFSKDPKRKLDLIPGDFRLVKYSLMEDSKKLASVKTRFLDFIANAKKEYDVVCIDCNPGSSFLTSCELHACTHILVPVKPDKYSILGLELLYEYLEGIPSIIPKPEIIVLLNGISRTHYDSAVEDELRAHPVFGSKTLAARLYHSKILIAHPDYTGFATDKRVPHKTKLKSEIQSVVDELATVLGLKT
jgi:chromosome partitioning protein